MRCTSTALLLASERQEHGFIMRRELKETIMYLDLTPGDSEEPRDTGAVNRGCQETPPSLTGTVLLCHHKARGNTQGPRGTWTAQHTERAPRSSTSEGRPEWRSCPRGSRQVLGLRDPSPQQVLPLCPSQCCLWDPALLWQSQPHTAVEKGTRGSGQRG